MVGTIIPIVHGERAAKKQVLTPWFFGAATIVGGALVGAGTQFAGTFARLASPTPLTFDAVLCVMGLVLALDGLHFIAVPLPRIRRQVPARWRSVLAPRVLVWAYGVALGAGLATQIVAPAFYLLLTWVLLKASIPTAVLVLAAFGFGRGVTVAWYGLTKDHVGEVASFPSLLSFSFPVVELLNGIALAFVTGALVVQLVRALAAP
jgi:sulfite exporter TauE/SafE